jgi:hypothetical protein
LLDAIVQVDKAPGELAREQGADGGLAGTHESSEAENRKAGQKPTIRVQL